MNSKSNVPSLFSFTQGLACNEMITRRDYFAAAAMRGYLSSGVIPEEMLEELVKRSYEIADAMIKLGTAE